MKKTFIKIICLITALSLIGSLMVFAEDFPVSINVGAASVVNPGEEAVLTIDATINTGFDIQGVQVDFAFSDNFPELKKAEIVRNTTGWENTGVTKHNLLAVGNVIKAQSQLVAKITFDVPDNAVSGTEYVFTLTNAIAANASQEFSAKLNTDSIKVVVAGGKPTEDAQKPETKPDDTDDNSNVVVDKDTSTPSGNISQDKNSESDSNDKTDEEKTEESMPWKNPFSDVRENDWFYDGVRFVFENDLMSGVDIGTFAPNSTLTRAMLVTILYRLEGSPVSSTYDFSDVARNTWYTKGVDWAASAGIVNGIGDKMFAPNLPVTREQITVIFYNYAKYKEMNLTAEKDLSSYADDNEISSWAATAFEWAVASGLISGKDNNKLDPLGSATRAETSSIIKRYAENIMEK